MLRMCSLEFDIVYIVYCSYIHISLSLYIYIEREREIVHNKQIAGTTVFLFILAS